MGVKRIWHGWTSQENAKAYQDLLHQQIFPAIESNNPEGLRAIELFRREGKGEVEFITILTFDSLNDVKKFQGKDYEQSYVPEPARKLLKRWDEVAAHYEAVEKREPLRY